MNIYDDDVKIKGILIFLTVFVYGILALKYNPFNNRDLNIIDRS